MDIINILAPKGAGDEQFTVRGTLYLERPLSPSDGGITIFFRYSTTRSKERRQEMDFVDSPHSTVTIRTNTRAKYEPNRSYIVTQDGKLWLVKKGDIDYKKDSQQALRIFSVPVRTMFELQPLQQENTWKLP